MGARGPKPAAPVLADLTSEQVAQEGVDRLLRRAGRLAWELSPAATIHLPESVDWQGTQLGQTLGDLLAYAQRGGDAGEAQEGLIAALPALYASASDSGSYTVPDLGTLADRGDVVALCLVGAMARVALAQGEPVTAAQLATLAGLQARAVRRLSEVGELAGGDGARWSYEAAEALRWLGGRGWR